MVTAPPTRIRVSLFTSSARENPITATDWARKTTVKPSTNSAVAVTALPRTASETRSPDDRSRTRRAGHRHGCLARRPARSR